MMSALNSTQTPLNLGITCPKVGSPAPTSPLGSSLGASATTPTSSASSLSLKVGIACSAETVLHEDNWGLLEAFTSAGHEARIVIWNDPSISNWGIFDCVVVRTCWTLNISTRNNLLAWLKKVNKETILVNPYEVISWNTENQFLDQLYARGVNVVPSAFVPRSEPAISILSAIERQDWSEAIVLPAILPEEAMQVYVAAPLQNNNNNSSTVVQSRSVTTAASTNSPRGTLRSSMKPLSMRSETSPVAASAVAVALSDASQSNLWLKRVEELRGMVGDVLVRPFIRCILRDGELSFVFMGGMFSHCVRRLPNPDEFVTSQTLKYSSTQLYMPSDEALFFAISAYTALDATIRDTYGKGVAPVFARIDVIRDAANTLFVNSVELVDPVLFFKASGTAKTFVATVADYVKTVRARRGLSSTNATTPTSPAISLPQPLQPTLRLLDLPPSVVGSSRVGGSSIQSAGSQQINPPRLFDLMPASLQREMGTTTTVNAAVSLFPPIANATLRQSPPLF